MPSLAELERRLAALERARPTGQGVSELYGATVVRPFQSGLPVELTSVWNSATGYSWKQLLLSGVALAPDTIPLTGNRAVTPDSNTALTVGTRGWLEPDPAAGGWLFIAAGTSTVSVIAWKEPVRVATVVNGTDATAFENGDTVDGITLATGDRILRKNQSTASQNGIFVVQASGAPVRATDADTAAELLGAAVAVTEGTANSRSVWLCAPAAGDLPIVVGTTNLPWVRIGPPTTGWVEDTGGTVSITPDFTWVSATGGGGILTLPGAGTYLVTAVVAVGGQISATAPGFLGARIMNTTTSVAVSSEFIALTIPVVNIFCRGTVTIVSLVTVTAGDTLKIQAERWSGPTWTSAFISDSGTSTPCSMSYTRVG